MSIDYSPVTGSLGAQCPCCDGDDRIGYSIITDEYTCCACGLVGSVAEFHGHFAETHSIVAGQIDAKAIFAGSVNVGITRLPYSPEAFKEKTAAPLEPKRPDAERIPEVWAGIASFSASRYATHKQPCAGRGRESHEPHAADDDATGSPVRPRLGGSTTPV